MWTIDKKNIFFKKNKKILFSDTLDHWHNGLCRLLNIEENKARDWIEYIYQNKTKRSWSNLNYYEKYDHIIHMTNKFFNVSNNNSKNFKNISNIKILGHNFDKCFAVLKYNDKNFYIMGSKKINHGVLFDSQFKYVSAIKYEEEYFEGEIEKVGYGNYKKQSKWRIEKSINLLKMINKYSDIKDNAVLLDLGSGYGFFRYAAEKSGIKHYGLEISKYANKMCKKLYGFDNFEGEIWDFEPRHKFDVITCFDVIEHISNTDDFLKKVKSLLKKNGLFVIRTPNLNSFEYKCFKSLFYSLKVEHLNYFSPQSLSLSLSKNGFDTIHAQTTSHLFQGFHEFPLDVLKSNMEGSDIFLIGKLYEKG
tara:strand:+ start:2803 stop:3888 length:1086 start_codon:yes stop_codon:yes gene_type:complete